MKTAYTLFLTLLLSVVATAWPTGDQCRPQQPHGGRKYDAKPAYFVLAGDSTTTTQNSGGGGWGAGFLNDTLCPLAGGKNYGHNGATTVSFRAGGDWDTVLDRVKNYTDSHEVFVTIQVS